MSSKLNGERDDMDELKIETPKVPGMRMGGALDCYTREQADAKFQEKLTDEQLQGIADNAGGKTSEGGEIFNDYENNQALCEFSTSMGQRTTSGMRAFRILSKSGTEGETGQYTLDSVEGLDVGDVYSLVLGPCDNDRGEIVEIDASTNTVTVTNFSNNSLVSDAAIEAQPWENTLSVNEKPNIGTIDIGFGALATGVDTIALRVGSHSSGYKTKAIWIGSDAGGIKTFASFAAFARGAYCEARGYYSYSNGSGCIVYVDCGFAHGLQLISSKTQLQALFGQYNVVDDDAIFIIANGKSNSGKNVFVVKTDGRVVLGAEPVEEMDAVPKKYLEQYIINNSADGTKQDKYAVVVNDAIPIAQEVTVELSLDRDSIANIKDSFTNLISTPYKGESKTENGITFTINSDNSISIKGTATDVATFIIDDAFETTSGTYIISGNQTINELNGLIYLYYRYNGTNDNSIDVRYLTPDSIHYSGAIKECSGGTGRIQITVTSGTVVDMTLLPQISLFKNNIDYANFSVDGAFYKADSLSGYDVYKGTGQSAGNTKIVVGDMGNKLYNVKVTYKQNLNDVIQKLRDAIISLGGNV